MEAKQYHIDELSLLEAQTLINNGLAGFYAYRAQAPIAHPEAMCVFAQGKWYHIWNSEFLVEDRGIVAVPDIPGGWSRAHWVTVDADHPIARLLILDAEQDRGPDTAVPISKIIKNMPKKRRL